MSMPRGCVFPRLRVDALDSRTVAAHLSPPVLGLDAALDARFQGAGLRNVSGHFSFILDRITSF